jgi:hypothetical protein
MRPAARGKAQNNQRELSLFCFNVSLAYVVSNRSLLMKKLLFVFLVIVAVLAVANRIRSAQHERHEKQLRAIVRDLVDRRSTAQIIGSHPELMERMDEFAFHQSENCHIYVSRGPDRAGHHTVFVTSKSTPWATVTLRFRHDSGGRYRLVDYQSVGESQFAVQRR